MPTTPHPDHPLPPIHPRVWEEIPPSLVGRIVDLVRGPLITYALTTDPKVKTRTIIDLHRLPNELLQKVRGDRGKTLTRLSNRLHKLAASHALFSSSPVLQPVPSIASSIPPIEIWTDGSCSAATPGAQGKTGIGIVVVDAKTGDTKEHSAYLGSGTNNTAELNAILYALDLYRATPTVPLLIWSDSEYAIGQCGTDRTNTNRKLVTKLRTLIAARHPKPQMKWVKAHADNPHNETADRLAKLARTTEQPRLPPDSIILTSTLPTSSTASSTSSTLSAGHTLDWYIDCSDDYICDHCDKWYPETYMCKGHGGNCDYVECESCYNALRSSRSSNPSRSPPPPPQAPQAPPPSLCSSSLSSTAMPPTSLPSSQSSSPSLTKVTMHGAPDPSEAITNGEDAAATLRRQVHRAAALARAGHLRRATQVIERPPLPPLTRDRIAHLISLHPRRQINMRPPADLADCVTPVVDAAALLKFIRDCDDGSAAGPSNLTAAHLVAIASDKDCLTGLCAIVQDVINGDLEPEAADTITAAISIATDKGHGQVRPLAIPEIFYKLAGLVCLESIRDSVPFLFPRIQLGCGIKGGPEIAIHRTQLALETGGPGTVVLRLDFRNAFNERQRHVLAQALFTAPSTSRLWKFFFMAYGGEGTYMGVYQRGRLILHFLNSQGVKQGCPIASFLYALSVQHLYERCVCDTPDVEAYAVADDLTLIGPALSVLRALNTLVTLCRDDGPTLNLKKCEALWAYSTDHPSYLPFLSAMHEHGVLMAYDAVNMLGSTIGLGMSRAAHCLAVVEQHHHFLSALAHPDMPTQVAVLLLRLSGVPRLTYLTRVTPPIIIRSAAERFDELLLVAAAAKTSLPHPGSDPNTNLILTLPLRHDGMGIRPHTRSSPCAYWASMAAAAHAIRDTHTIDAISNRLRGTDTLFHLTDSHAVLIAAGVDPADKRNRQSFPATINDFWSLYAAEAEVKHHLQGHLSTIADDTYLLRTPILLPITATTPMGANLPASTTPASTAHLWLAAVPNSHDTNINSRHYSSALRHRYNLPAADNLPSHCKCNARLTPSHFHSCKLIRRTGVLTRHDTIVKTLLTHARRAGIVTRREDPLRDNKGQRTIPDFLMITHTGTIHVDVSVCSTYADSNMNRDDPIRAREQQKSKKYDRTCADNNSSFIPFVVDSVGRLGQGALRVIDLIVTQHHVNVLTPDRHLRAKITDAVSVQLQIGNALVDDAALTMIGRRSGPPAHPDRKQPHHPPITHDTLRRPPASPNLLPSANSPSPPDSPPDRESKEQKSFDEQESKRSGAPSRHDPATNPDPNLTLTMTTTTPTSDRHHDNDFSLHSTPMLSQTHHSHVSSLSASSSDAPPATSARRTLRATSQLSSKASVGLEAQRKGTPRTKRTRTRPRTQPPPPSSPPPTSHLDTHSPSSNMVDVRYTPESTDDSSPHLPDNDRPPSAAPSPPSSPPLLPGRSRLSASPIQRDPAVTLPPSQHQLSSSRPSAQPSPPTRHRKTNPHHSPNHTKPR